MTPAARARLDRRAHHKRRERVRWGSPYVTTYVSQAPIEVLIDTRVIYVSQAPLEVLLAPDPTAFVSQAPLEVLLA